MIQYNVTIKIESEVEAEWSDYMENKHVPDVLNTGLFLHCRISKLIQNEEEGATYTIQYILSTMKDMHMYQTKYASKLQSEHTEKFKGKFVAFRTLMEVVSEMKAQ
ncbi:MAG: DUF4286 family protein [Bacteroidetes bacterium]|jgi:hypothetical protein|nr:DUF4286 family protein [Bacteroidota bacterium]